VGLVFGKNPETSRGHTKQWPKTSPNLRGWSTGMGWSDNENSLGGLSRPSSHFDLEGAGGVGRCTGSAWPRKKSNSQLADVMMLEP